MLFVVFLHTLALFFIKNETQEFWAFLITLWFIFVVSAFTILKVWSHIAWTLHITKVLRSALACSEAPILICSAVLWLTIFLVNTLAFVSVELKSQEIWALLFTYEIVINASAPVFFQMRSRWTVLDLTFSFHLDAFTLFKVRSQARS